MKWYCEPPEWHQKGDVLQVITGREGDFWQNTHYGFIHDNGHFAYDEKTGDFTIEVCVEAEFQALYDQAGLMIRRSPQEWIKCGIEFFGGKRHFSVVVTHTYSDWSVLEWPYKGAFWVRLIRKGDAVVIQASRDGKDWQMIRLCYFPLEEPVLVGPMTCSPTREGLKAEFSKLRIYEAVAFDA